MMKKPIAKGEQYVLVKGSKYFNWFFGDFHRDFTTGCLLPTKAMAASHLFNPLLQGAKIKRVRIEYHLGEDVRPARKAW